MRVDASPLILIHSPLVGGSFWQPIAGEVERRGRRCYAPAIQTSENAPVLPWRHWAERLCDTLPPTSRAILVGHSAAGLLLPALARKVDAYGLIFVDANIPPESGTARPVDPEFMQFVQALPVVDGRLPRWSDWWPKDAMKRLIPDEQERQRFDQDLPRLNMAWFEDSLQVPEWGALRVGYVQTSERFSQESDRAQMRGWPVVVLKGTHLHPLLAPLETTEAILTIARQLEASARRSLE